MPHAELKYSADLDIDPKALLMGIEAILQRHDPGSGDCKGRAYPAPVSHHANMIVEISLLPKAHRDEAFMTALREDLAAYLREVLPNGIWMSLHIRFSTLHYVTEVLE
ncbi:hypothetical protein [Aestuariivita sp.]|jgi:hypothetical protein|uniref:hypothetical protein n=1 Tax=Aestuariivita sp. TaxID=1872407 RepID=UPI00216D23C2|nr:hypothetical protein [Aestuariivita sp.]MCE8005683.1 hypothetical protein [Aestuariivita sp.]